MVKSKLSIRTLQVIFGIVGMLAIILGIVLPRIYLPAETGKMLVRGTQPTYESRILSEGDIVVVTTNSSDVTAGLIPFDRWVLLKKSGESPEDELILYSNVTWVYETSGSFIVYKTDRWVLWATGQQENSTGEVNVCYSTPALPKEIGVKVAFFGGGLIPPSLVQIIAERWRQR